MDLIEMVSGLTYSFYTSQCGCSEAWNCLIHCHFETGQSWRSEELDLAFRNELVQLPKYWTWTYDNDVIQ